MFPPPRSSAPTASSLSINFPNPKVKPPDPSGAFLMDHFFDSFFQMTYSEWTDPFHIKKYFPFISTVKTSTIIPETRQGARDGESEGQS
jgi:hypothetical protein